MSAAPTAVTCPWCRFYYAKRPARGVCDNCTGPLPAPSGVDRGSGPPATPRALPAPYRRSVLLGRNVLSILGLVFSCVGAPFLVAAAVLAATRAPVALSLVFGPIGLVFGGSGVPLLMAGLRRGRARLAALEHGVPAEGEVISVDLKTSVRVNGRSPWVIEYSFQTAGGPVRGSTQSFALSEYERRAGDRVWVVYLPTDPTTSTLWPPLP